MTLEDKILEEITETKKRQWDAMETNAKCKIPNPYFAEYIKGYICALSYVEGFIANLKLRGDEDDE